MSKVILLIKSSDNTCFGNVEKHQVSIGQLAKDKAGCYKQGYLVGVFPENYTFGKEELNPKKFIRVILDESLFDFAWLEEDKEFFCKRKYRLPLENILDPFQLSSLKSGFLESLEPIELKIKPTFVLTNYNKLPEPFGVYW